MEMKNNILNEDNSDGEKEAEDAGSQRNGSHKPKVAFFIALFNKHTLGPCNGSGRVPIILAMDG